MAARVVVKIMRYDINIPLNFFKQTKNAPRSEMCCASIQKKNMDRVNLFFYFKFQKLYQKVYT